jgi:hypothetical protein
MPEYGYDYKVAGRVVCGQMRARYSGCRVATHAVKIKLDSSDKYSQAQTLQAP